MTPRNLRSRVIAPALAASLAAASLIAFTATPASAATSTFSQDTDIFFDEGGADFSNTAAIAIPQSGPANPYPSGITIGHAAKILDVDVRLLDVSDDYPDDIDVMLVGPGGQQVTLMSDAGGSDDLVAVDLGFDDEAASSLPDGTQISAGTFKPTNYETGDGFPAPAPATNNNTSLSVFDGLNAAGTWQLYVNDDFPIDNPGSIIGGWSLDIDLASDPYPSTLSVSGLPPITDVNVSVVLDSQSLDDVTLLLVGPGGQQSLFLSDAGGDGNAVTGATLKFDDEAAAPPPDDTPFGSGTYKPVNYDAVETFASPAPATSGNVPLSIFDGLSPNGQWQLFTQDDNSGNDLQVVRKWSLEFSWADTQVPSGTIAVNGGAASTSSTAVTLNLTSSDPAPASGVTQMHFSNDGVTFSAYQPVAATAAWNLTAGDGVKTVYAQFRDADGNQSAVVSDAITLALPDTTSPTAVKTTPKKNAKGVKVDTKVKLKVSEALKATTVNAKTVYLKAKGSSKKVKAKVSYNARGKTIVLTPKSPLKHNKKYTFTATTKVKDAAGNALDGAAGRSGAQAVKFSFTTG